MATRTHPQRGEVSSRFGHLGVWNLSLGPHSAVPGERLEVCIVDTEGNIVRRLEQIKGRCTDPGYVDFFLSQNCRPSSNEYPIVDIDENGRLAGILCSHYTQAMGMDLYLHLLTKWVTEHGKPEYAF